MILIVEPSKDLAKIISQALAREGLETKVAHTAEQAIKLADEGEIQVVVLELIMPRHNGLEFIYEFRSYADWFDVPIIGYSQLSSEELGIDKQLAREMGIISHLYKPTTSLDTLVSEVQKVLK